MTAEKADSFRMCFLDTLEEARGDKPYRLPDFMVEVYEIRETFVPELQIHVLYTPYGYNYISTCPESVTELTPNNYHVIWKWFKDISMKLLEKLDEISLGRS